jgi:hypothetical protein
VFFKEFCDVAKVNSFWTVCVRYVRAP